MSQPLQYQAHRLIELLNFEFVDTGYVDMEQSLPQLDLLSPRSQTCCSKRQRLPENRNTDIGHSYQRKSTSAGRARRSAFSAFAASLPPKAVQWASCVEDARKITLLSCEYAWLQIGMDTS